MHKLHFQYWQDDENALLQQALAMSMDEPSSTTAVGDADMSDAAVDEDLQLGKCIPCACFAFKL